jgi:hypothetical protein
MPGGILQREERSLRVDAKQPVEIRLGNLHNRPVNQFDSGVRDHDVETTEVSKCAAPRPARRATPKALLVNNLQDLFNTQYRTSTP